MNYLFNRNFLLLLTVGGIIHTRVQGTLIEPKVPELVNACIGSHTTINCTFYADVKGLKVNWYFDKTSDFNDRKKIEFHSSNGSSRYHEDKARTASYLTIRNVTFNDSGWYFCEVIQDIPRLIKNLSNGTQLVIYSPTTGNLEDNTTNSTTTYGQCLPIPPAFVSTHKLRTTVSETPNASPWWLWVALAVGCALIVATVIITIVICGRKKEAPVYENTKEALKRHWKEDQSLHHCTPSNGYSNKKMDTLKPHNYECHPKESPVYENTKEDSRRYGKKD